MWLLSLPVWNGQNGKMIFEGTVQGVPLPVVQIGSQSIKCVGPDNNHVYGFVIDTGVFNVYEANVLAVSGAVNVLAGAGKSPQNDAQIVETLTRSQINYRKAAV